MKPLPWILCCSKGDGWDPMLHFNNAVLLTMSKCHFIVPDKSELKNNNAIQWYGAGLRSEEPQFT